MAESHCRRKVSNKIRIHKIFPAFLYKIPAFPYKITKNRLTTMKDKIRPYLVFLVSTIEVFNVIA